MYSFLPSYPSPFHHALARRTASELKLKRVQDTPTGSTSNDTAFLGLGIDMTSGAAYEAADRALSSVARKLDKSLSVEYTVNELIAEATDILNLATIYHGLFHQFLMKCYTLAHCIPVRMESIPIEITNPHDQSSQLHLYPQENSQ